MPSREERKKKITRQRTEQILDAALLVFSERGFDRATIPEIAESAGVSVGTIYNYFESKRDLLTSIVSTIAIEPFVQMIAVLPRDDDHAYVEAIIENRLELGMENMSRFFPIFYEIQRDEELRRTFSGQMMRPLLAGLEAYLSSRMEAGAFKKRDAAVIARAMVGMVLGFILVHSLERESSPVHTTDRKQLASQLADLILSAVKH